MIYLSSQLAEVHPVVFNSPFEDFEESASPHGPCRTIKVTAEVRRLDQAAKDAHLPAEWLAFRATLSMENLRKKAAPRMDAPLMNPCGRRMRLSGRACGCGKMLSYDAIGERCVTCLRAFRTANRKPLVRADRVPCDLCPRLLRVGRKGMCHVCKDKNRRKA